MDIKALLEENFSSKPEDYIVSQEGFGDIVASWRRYKARGIGINLNMTQFDKPIEILKKIQQGLKKDLQKVSDRTHSVVIRDKSLLEVFYINGKLSSDPLRDIKHDQSHCKELLIDFSSTLKDYVSKLQDFVKQVVDHKRFAGDVRDSIFDLTPPLLSLKPAIFKPDTFLNNEYIPDIDRQRSEQELLESPEDLHFKKHRQNKDDVELTLDCKIVEELIKAVDGYINLMLQTRKTFTDIGNMFVRIYEYEKKAEQQEEDEDSVIDGKFYSLTQIAYDNIYSGMATEQKVLQHIMRSTTAITKLCRRYTK